MKEYLTKEQTDKLFNTITSNGCREMEEDRFHQAVNEAINISSQLDPLVMPLLIKDEIAQKLIDRLNLYEKQYASDYGFINKQKIAHKVKELKKCIQIVQSA